MIVCHDEIIVEINGHHASNENSDIEMDVNGDSLQEDDDEDEANSEEKLLKTCNNNNNELVVVKLHSEEKRSPNGVGVNGFDELCFKISQMGW